MKPYFYLLFLVGFIFTSSRTTKLDDYYWRDYEGTIPQDALQASRSGRNNIQVYVGQALFQEKIIPGKIYENDKNIYFAYFDVKHSTDANVKILCTNKPSNFRWIPVRNTDVLTLPKESLIKGGFEPNCDSYVGRVEINGQLSPGKVICCKNAKDCYGLYTTNNAKGSLYDTFEILRYNENGVDTPNVENPNFDIRNKEEKRGKCKNVVINYYN